MMKRSAWRKIALLLLLPVILLSHCSSNETAFEALKQLPAAEKPHSASRVTALGYLDQSTLSAPLSSGNQSIMDKSLQGIDRYLIKNAYLTLEVKNPQKTTNEINQMLQTLGGYLSDMNENVDGLGRRFCILQIRIPSTQLDSFLSGMEPLGKLEKKTSHFGRCNGAIYRFKSPVKKPETN